MEELEAAVPRNQESKIFHTVIIAPLEVVLPPGILMNFIKDDREGVPWAPVFFFGKKGKV